VHRTHRTIFVASLAVAGLALAACGSSSKGAAAAGTTVAAVTTTADAYAAPTTTAAPAVTTTAAASSAAAPTGPATVAVGGTMKVPVLLDGKGKTLYLFTKDTGTASTCSGKCAAAWPALLTKGAPVAGTGVDATKLGSSVQADGTSQVTYNGHLLYYFAGDKAAGDTAGQGVGGVWFVVDATGAAVTA